MIPVEARPTSTHGQPHYYLQVRTLSKDTRARSIICPILLPLIDRTDNRRKSPSAAENQAVAPLKETTEATETFVDIWESGRCKLVAANTTMPGTILDTWQLNDILKRKIMIFQIFLPRPSHRLSLATGLANIKATCKSNN